MANDDAPKSVLRDTDEEARRLAKTLLREARFGALAALEPETGAPLASRVALAPDMDGAPIFLISQLSSHFGALEADARASLLIGEPGKGDPLAHPRLTAIGQAERIASSDERARVKARYLGRHPKAALYADFGDFAFWRLRLERISLNGGFGKAYALAAEDALTALSACAGLPEAEAGAVAHMNEDHADALAAYAEGLLNAGPGAWRLASLDPEGLDLALGDQIRRLWFDPPLESAEALRSRLAVLAKKARSALDQP
ncbi:MAG: DUF2470 domain-containing protein [Pseudomonadota bacterium]